jgi:hypothetical protein
MGLPAVKSIIYRNFLATDNDQEYAPERLVIDPDIQRVLLAKIEKCGQSTTI